MNVPTCDVLSLPKALKSEAKSLISLKLHRELPFTEWTINCTFCTIVC